MTMAIAAGLFTSFDYQVAAATHSIWQESLHGLFQVIAELGGLELTTILMLGLFIYLWRGGFGAEGRQIQPPPLEIFGCCDLSGQQALAGHHDWSGNFQAQGNDHRPVELAIEGEIDPHRYAASLEIRRSDVARLQGHFAERKLQERGRFCRLDLDPLVALRYE